MSNRPKLDKLLKNQSSSSRAADLQGLLCYAEGISKIENVVAVVSDLKNNTSRIYSGKFGALLGIEGYRHESSIWEKMILDLMTEEEREEKYLAELRFFNFLRHRPRNMRGDYYLASRLRVMTVGGKSIDILHRMYYVYSADGETVCYAVCLYGCMAFDFTGSSVVVNSTTGATEELAADKDVSILSKRERQVLKLIDCGRTSADIAELLSISKHTVSRHRQDILAKLQVRTSVEACKIAKSIGLI